MPQLEENSKPKAPLRKNRATYIISTADYFVMHLKLDKKKASMQQTFADGRCSGHEVHCDPHTLVRFVPHPAYYVSQPVIVPRCGGGIVLVFKLTSFKLFTKQTFDRVHDDTLALP